MGEAKRRGTKAERASEAEARRMVEEFERQRAARIRWESMTQAERNRAVEFAGLSVALAAKL